MFLGKTSTSNFDQLLQDKMWTLRLDRAHVLARPTRNPEEKWSFGIDDDEDMLDCEQAFLKIFWVRSSDRSERRRGTGTVFG